MENKFKFIWVDSRTIGVGSSWYYGGSDEMTLDELQYFLDKCNAVAVYDGVFYDNVKDIPLKQRNVSIDEFGMPTGMYIAVNPMVTVVPKGTTFENPLGYPNTRRFKFPDGYLDQPRERPPRKWRELIEK